MNIVFKLRKILFFVLLLIIFSFLYLKIVPRGKISYERNWPDKLKSGKGFIYSFSPADRVDLTSGKYPRIIGDPVYFSLFTPRPFNTVELEIKYRDNLGYRTPVIEAGVLVDKLVWRYDLKPVENKLLEQFLLNWSLIKKGDVLFLQKEKKYNTLAEFKANLKQGKLKDCSGQANTCLALYNYSLNFHYHLPANQLIKPIVLNNPLRGMQQFFVYVRSGSLSLDFELVDLNQDKAPDPILLTLYSGDKIIDRQEALDTGTKQTSGILEEKHFSIRKSGLPAGVYKVELKVSNDIVVKKITSSSNKLSFINKIWPVSTKGNLNIYTDVNYIQVKAMSPASRQTLNFARQNFKISKTYQQFDFYPVLPQTVNLIKLQKDDVILENNGMFAWSANSLFDPTIKKLNRYVKLAGHIKYILAHYQKPIEKDGWKTAKIEFNLKSAYREKGKYSFIISIPGLKTSDGSNEYMEIKSLEMKLTGRTLWQKIKSSF